LDVRRPSGRRTSKLLTQVQKRDILKSTKVDQFCRNHQDKRAKKALIVLFLTLFLLAGLVALSRLQKFAITNIKVSGESVLTKNEIKSVVENELLGHYFFLFPKNNFFIYPKNKIELVLLDKLKRIEEINISKDDIHTILIQIKERSSKYMLCDVMKDEKDQEDCYFVDSRGYVFAVAPHFSGNVYFRFYDVSGVGTTTTSTGIIKENNLMGKNFVLLEEFSNFLRLKEDFSNNGLNPVSLSIVSKDDAELQLEGIGEMNPKILFKRTANTDRIFTNFSAAIGTEPLLSLYKNNFAKLLYIDLRFNNKVYYKFQ